MRPLHPVPRVVTSPEWPPPGQPLGALCLRVDGMRVQKQPGTLSGRLVKQTQRFWHERAGCPVSEEDAREAIRNTSALFDLLATWDQEFHPTPTQLEDQEHH